MSRFTRSKTLLLLLAAGIATIPSCQGYIYDSSCTKDKATADFLDKGLQSALDLNQAGIDVLGKKPLSPDENNLAKWLFNSEQYYQQAADILNDVNALSKKGTLPTKPDDVEDVIIFCDYSRFKENQDCEGNNDPGTYCDTYYDGETELDEQCKSNKRPPGGQGSYAITEKHTSRDGKPQAASIQLCSWYLIDQMTKPPPNKPSYLTPKTWQALLDLAAEKAGQDQNWLIKTGLKGSDNGKISMDVAARFDITLLHEMTHATQPKNPDFKADDQPRDGSTYEWKNIIRIGTEESNHGAVNSESLAYFGLGARMLNPKQNVQQIIPQLDGSVKAGTAPKLRRQDGSPGHGPRIDPSESTTLPHGPGPVVLSSGTATAPSSSTTPLGPPPPPPPPGSSTTPPGPPPPPPPPGSSTTPPGPPPPPPPPGSSTTPPGPPPPPPPPGSSTTPPGPPPPPPPPGSSTTPPGPPPPPPPPGSSTTPPGPPPPPPPPGSSTTPPGPPPPPPPPGSSTTPPGPPPPPPPPGSTKPSTPPAGSSTTSPRPPPPPPPPGSSTMSPAPPSSTTKPPGPPPPPPGPSPSGSSPPGPPPPGPSPPGPPLPPPIPPGHLPPLPLPPTPSPSPPGPSPSPPGPSPSPPGPSPPPGPPEGTASCETKMATSCLTTISTTTSSGKTTAETKTITTSCKTTQGCSATDTQSTTTVSPTKAPKASANSVKHVADLDLLDYQDSHPTDDDGAAAPAAPKNNPPPPQMTGQPPSNTQPPPSSSPSKPAPTTMATSAGPPPPPPPPPPPTLCVYHGAAFNITGGFDVGPDGTKIITAMGQPGDFYSQHFSNFNDNRGYKWTFYGEYNLKPPDKSSGPPETVGELLQNNIKAAGGGDAHCDESSANLPT